MSEPRVSLPPLQPPQKALRRLLSMLPAPTRQESVELLAAERRVLVNAQRALCAVPPWDNSAMDGYALSSADLARGQRQFVVSQRIAAGAMAAPLVSGTAARIFTGAVMPPGADAVIIQENCADTATGIEVLQTAKAGENVRRAGDDVKQGELLFDAGHRLRAVDTALLAACGIERLQVWCRPRVAVLTTGDELVEPGCELAPGQIYNANRYLLTALLRGAGCEPVLLENVPDTLAATTQALTEAAAQADCVISSGGVSVGGEDHVRDAVKAVGELDLWRLAIKPGKPFAFGRLPACNGNLSLPFFGLPGNPVSAFVTFCLLLRPALQYMAGASVTAAPTRQLPADFVAETGDRQEYWRVSVVNGAQLVAYHNQSSAVLSSLTLCDGLAVLPPHSRIRRGQLLSFMAFDDIVSAH